jgi:hypothetical protein
MFLLASCASILAGISVRDSWQRWTTTEHAIASTRTLATTLRTVEVLGLERAASTTVLGAREAQIGVTTKALQDARGVTDQTFQSLALATMALIGEETDATQRLTETRSVILAMRLRLDAILAKPAPDRDLAIADEIQNSVAALQRN